VIFINMKYTIYKITNTKNGKIYIGKHQTLNVNDSYFGSGLSLERAIKKYGKKSFTKEILFIFDNEFEMNEKEKELVNEEFISTNKTYNMGLGGEGGSHFKGKKHTEETKKRLSEIAKGQVHSEETRKKISEANRKRVVSEETRKKLSDKVKERFLSQEFRDKFSENVKKGMTEEVKNKISVAAKIREKKKKSNVSQFPEEIQS
jgi:group I intron endonuclease